jgi:hypothetical protein
VQFAPEIIYIMHKTLSRKKWFRSSIIVHFVSLSYLNLLRNTRMLKKKKKKIRT